jgi:hypothetical protein
VHTVVARTLRREFRLHLPTAAIADELCYVAAEPELPELELEIIDIEARLRDGFVVTQLPTSQLVEGTPGHLLSAMHHLVMTDLTDGEPTTPFIHGATVRVEGKRLLLIGHKGAGKSTLSLHLALSGHAVEGDEHLLVRSDSVIARPRTLRVKDGSLALIPNLPPAVWTSPTLANWDGPLIRSIAPDIGGVPWVIRAGRLDAIICLVGNHSGSSVSRPIPGATAFERLMREILLPRSGIAAAAGRLRQLALGTPTYELLLGNLAAAEWHLKTIARSLT